MDTEIITYILIVSMSSFMFILFIVLLLIQQGYGKKLKVNKEDKHDRVRSCHDCKYDDYSIEDHPCCECIAQNYNLYELKKEVKKDFSTCKNRKVYNIIPCNECVGSNFPKWEGEL